MNEPSIVLEHLSPSLLWSSGHHAPEQIGPRVSPGTVSEVSDRRCETCPTAESVKSLELLAELAGNFGDTLMSAALEMAL